MRIVPRPDTRADIAERVRQALHAALEEVGVATPLRVEAVAAIEGEGHAAKLTLVKRHLA